MRLIIVRHGETVENVKHVCQGQCHGTLTPLGLRQAGKVAARLKNEKIDAIYASDLERAAKTAREIARFHPHVPLTFTPALRERGFGSFEGKRMSSALWRSVEEAVKEGNGRGPEPLRKIYCRVRAFLNRVQKRHRKDTVLFVSHGFCIMTLIAVLLKIAPEHFACLQNFHNTGVSVIDIKEDGKHRFQVYDCTKHLQKS